MTIRNPKPSEIRALVISALILTVLVISIIAAAIRLANAGTICQVIGQTTICSGDVDGPYNPPRTIVCQYIGQVLICN